MTAPGLDTSGAETDPNPITLDVEPAIAPVSVAVLPSSLPGFGAVKVAMKELKGHIYHKKRKWQCPKCKRVRMQVHKPR